MTNNIAAGNAGNCSPSTVYENYGNYGPPDLSYRLWHTDVVADGRPNAILVHGSPAIRLGGENCTIPMPGHVRERPNNYFCNLGSLLHNDLYGGHNVWEFEYADKPVLDPITQVPIEDPITHEILYFNFGDIATYGERLAQAIGVVKTCNPDVAVNIIAHSMGGLVTRHAAQNGSVNKIITLDTGHCGFNLAGFFDRVIQDLPEDIRHNAPCVHETAPGSDFLNDLNSNFHRDCRINLLSRAAGDSLPFVGRVAELSSSSMGQVGDDGKSTGVNYGINFDIVKNVNHLSYIEINDETHPAFCKIVESLGHNC